MKFKVGDKVMPSKFLFDQGGEGEEDYAYIKFLVVTDIDVPLPSAWPIRARYPDDTYGLFSEAELDLVTGE